MSRAAPVPPPCRKGHTDSLSLREKAGVREGGRTEAHAIETGHRRFLGEAGACRLPHPGPLPKGEGATGSFLKAGLVALLLGTPVAAQAQALGPPDRTEAFERSAAESYYTFDACGDGLAGRLYRRALAERFASCAFAPAARARYGLRIQAQGDKARKAINDMIEGQGGLPVQLDGLSGTCHARWADEGYGRLRRRLLQYAAGDLPATAIVAAPCDAPAITPDAAGAE